MFNSIRNDLKSQWGRPNSGLQRLIIINGAVFIFVNLALLFIPSAEAYEYFIRFFAMPTDLDSLLIRPWTFITSFFTHTGFWHILFNMMFLYWFGMIVREYLGSDRLINLYFLGGLFGSLSIVILFNLVPQFEQAAGGIALGASAGVFAIMIAAATLVPDHTFYLLFFGPVKIKYIAAFHILFAVLGLKGHNYGGELAHLAGAFIGYIYVRQLQRGNDIGAWISSFFQFVKSFFSPQPKMKVNYGSAKKSSSRKSSSKSSSTVSRGSSKNEPSQDEIDAILDKISTSGYESLSKTEKEKLFNASKK